MKFYDLLKINKVKEEDIHDFIDKWHNSCSSESVYEFLGIDEETFNHWVRTNCLI